MNQEPGSEVEIKEFVTDQFKLNFPLMAKVKVNGKDAHELFKCLRSRSKELKVPKSGKTKEIPWNFGKFIINRQGDVVKFVGPKEDLSA